jgi:hypothetical protein
MSEEIIKSENQVIRVGDGIGDMNFSSDEELAVFLERVDRRNEAVERVLKMALSKLMPTDFHDFDGKPMLQGVGAQRLMKYFGISVTNKQRIPAMGYAINQQDPAKRLSVTYKATFSLGSMVVEGEGRRDSHNKFFGRKGGEYKDISDINLPDLDAAAVTAMYRDGITTLLGLKGVTWDYLKELGFCSERTTGHTYQKGTNGGNAAESQEAKSKQAEIANMIFEMSGQDPEKSKEMLIKYTAWKTKEGKEMAGKDSVSKLSDKQVPIIYGKVKNDYDEYLRTCATVESAEVDFEPDQLQNELGF